MQKYIYKKKEINNWREFVAKKYAEFLYSNYANGKPMPKDKDIYRVAGETIDADIILSLEDDEKIIGMTSYRVFPNFIWVKELCVDFGYRGQGISNKLRQWMIDESKPSTIVGLAHNPISVISRSKIFRTLGYQTYWGNLPVDEGSLSEEDIHKISLSFIEKAYPQHLDKYKEGIVAYADANIWAEESVDVYQNNNIMIVLNKIINFQKINHTPAMATLVSIKNS